MVAFFVGSPAGICLTFGGLNHLNELRWAGVKQSQLMKASIIFPALLGQKFLGNRNLLVKSSSFSECHDFSMEGLSNSANIKSQKEAQRMASGLTITFTFVLLSYCMIISLMSRIQRKPEAKQNRWNHSCKEFWSLLKEAHQSATSLWLPDQLDMDLWKWALLDWKPLKFHCWPAIEKPKKQQKKMWLNTW